MIRFWFSIAKYARPSVIWFDAPRVVTVGDMVIGDIYSKLTVLELLPKGRVRCACACGKETTALKQNIQRGRTKSCGCGQYSGAAKRIRHGMTESAEYRIWRHIRTRCENGSDPAFKWYGARGIQICERWLKFENFYEDMGPRPGPEYSIDRKDNSGNYEPGNCRWATDVEQARNRRNNRIVVARGEARTAAEWAEIVGIDLKLLCARLDKGWDPERAVFEPTADPAARAERHDVFGEWLSVAEAAAKYGISNKVLANARRRWTVEGYLIHRGFGPA